MAGSAPVPQVVVRGEATLLVEPEVADLGVTVTGRARDRLTALDRCRTRRAELTAVQEVSDAGLAGGGLRVAEAMASMARFEASDGDLELSPARQEVHGVVGVRFTMSRPDQEVFRG